MTSFLVPSFNKNIPDKINNNIDVVSEHMLINKTHDLSAHPAIATRGFPANRDGTYVFVTYIEKIMNTPYIRIGFTSTAAHDSAKEGRPGYGMNGICLNLNTRSLWGGNGVDDTQWQQKYLDRNIAKKAKEIISILKISNNGATKSVQFIVDGNEGPVHECAREHFENGGNEIFLVVTLYHKDQKLEFISFDKVKSRSPTIDALMKEFNRNKPAVLSSAPSTSTAENDALISQLRDRISRSQDALIQEKDKQLKEMREMYEKQLAVKDQQLATKDQQRDLSNQQLELERVEHQKTRNLLHQIKMELKDVELYYLRLHQQNESGQRRQREDEEQLAVKIEPGLDEENEKVKPKKTTKKK